MFCLFIFNSTPLHFASSNGHLGIVKYLINHAADIRIKDNNDVFFVLIELHFF